MSRRFVIAIAFCVVVAASLIAYMKGSKSSSGDTPTASQDSPTPAAISEPIEAPADSVTGSSEESETTDLQLVIESANGRQLTNDEALTLRNEVFGEIPFVQHLPDPYSYVPTVKVAPMFPPEVSQLGMSGFVLMEYSVVADGSIGPIAVLNASSPIFEIAAIRSVERYKYAPRIERGRFVDTHGVRTLVVYGEPENTPTVEEGTETIVVTASNAE